VCPDMHASTQQAGQWASGVGHALLYGFQPQKPKSLGKDQKT
jgi:hypothetical protein